MKTEAQKRAQAKYDRTLRGKERISIYRRSPKGKAVRRRWYLKLKTECFTHYGGTPPLCACCGENIIEFLELDHTNGGGNAQRKLLKTKGGKNFYVWLRINNWPSGYRVLCSNCNQAIGACGSCPHQKLLDTHYFVV
jgi:hypothetical protein